MKSALDWSEAKKLAREAVDRGLKLFWKIDLGLFAKLEKPLDNQTQFHALLLSLDHFKNTLWQEFRNDTVGLCLYEGSADFSKSFPWDDAQRENLQVYLAGTSLETADGQRLLALFCRDMAADYLRMLVQKMPDPLQLFLMLDATSCDGMELTAQLLHRECYPRFHLAIKGGGLPHHGYSWDGKTIKTIASKNEAIGVCLPLFSQNEPCAGLEHALFFLSEAKLPYRMIPEAFLISEWEGLDFLVYSPKGLSIQGKRKIQGFCAAGGTAVSVGELLGFAQEIGLSDWMSGVSKDTLRACRDHL
jgi:hypothetical protein